MRTVIAIVISITLASHVAAQCCGGGCCQGGSCGPMYYGPPPQQYRQPRQIEPDGIPTPQVGSPGTPQFHPFSPPGSNPSLQSPPPVQTPVMPPLQSLPNPFDKPQPPIPVIPAPAGDSANTQSIGEIKQLLIDIHDRPGCQCDNSKLETAVTALVESNKSLTLAITELKNTNPPATDKPAAPVGAPRLYLRAVPLN